MSDEAGTGPMVKKISAKKRLQKEWVNLTQRRISFKKWVNDVIDTGEPADMVNHAETWLLNKVT